ncbi:hypothetical protein QFZ31_005882 [Neobacillus niacini]|uniref:hypothetical protein n=1 Tax=Neobacillus driksii TaxID=3035913 RepID=UPI00278AC10E|nr:hypothetical protein [Neobacillus niacini]MDQ0976004.1 hypothetical protein [Neobacillus niacini]
MFKWWSTFLVIIPFVLIMGLLFVFKDFQRIFLVNDLPDSILNSSNLVSWLFGGIMSLLGFITLFIAFSYENKLLTASKIKQQLLRPYALSLEEIILNFSVYKLYISKDFLLNYIYWVFVIVSSISIFTWGIIICFYTHFEFLTLPIGYVQITNIIVVVIWGLLSFVLIAISILLNLIRSNKDPLEKGYLLNEIQLSDIQKLKEKNGDLQELFFKIAPTITILRIPQQDIEEYELNIHFPIKLSNIRFVAKIYNANKDVSIQMFGVIQRIDKIGESFSHIFTNQLSLANINLNENSHGNLKFYDKDNKLVSLLMLKANKSDEGLKYQVSDKMDLKLITNDNDYREIENRNDEFMDYTLID